VPAPPGQRLTLSPETEASTEKFMECSYHVAPTRVGHAFLRFPLLSSFRTITLLTAMAPKRNDPLPLVEERDLREADTYNARLLLVVIVVVVVVLGVFVLLLRQYDLSGF
jgi:hypothetical protein